MDLFQDLRRRDDEAPYERLARKALGAYGLDEARLDLVSQKDHVVFRVVDGAGKTATAYALRIYPSAWDRDRILRTFSWLTSLRCETGLPVPEPILTRSGEWIQSHSTPGISGFHQIALVSWVDGRRPKEWTTSHADAAGRRLAQLHAHSEAFDLSLKREFPRRTAETVAEQIDPIRLARAVAPDAEELLVDAVDRVRSSMSELGSGPRVAGLIHGNPTGEHVLFEERDARLIGFTHCRWGYYLYDIAFLGLSMGGRERGLDLRRSAIAAYREVRDLPADADRHLEAFTVLGLLDRLCEAAPTPDRPASEDRDVRRSIEELRRSITAGEDSLD